MGNIIQEKVSANKMSSYHRVWRLMSDRAADKHVEDNRKYRAKKKAERFLSQGSRKSHKLLGGNAIVRIKHHLSRGRDAGDIAIREGWLVSDVLNLIEKANAS